jgi:hypothetical protein
VLKLKVMCLNEVSRDSVVGTATSYGGSELKSPGKSRTFSSPRRPDRLWGPPNLLSNEYLVLFPGTKRSER